MLSIIYKVNYNISSLMKVTSNKPVKTAFI